MTIIKNTAPGLLLTFLIALSSIYFSSFILIGSVAIAILIGLLVNNIFLNKIEVFKSGISFSEKQLLSYAIILLGASLDFNSMSFLTIDKILIILVMIFISIFFCYLIGKLIELPKNLSLLLGIGNGVCGSSAIAGASKVIGTDENEVGISITIVNILGALSIFILPYILNNFFSYLTDQQSGFIIGSTVQAVGQVTAAGFIINHNVGEYAILIKMIRIIMLGPLLLLLNFLPFKKSLNKTNQFFSIPFFVIGFLIMAMLASFNLIPDNILLLLTKISKFLFIVAMAGIGLKISFKSILGFGLKPFIVALVSFTIQIIFALIIVNLIF